jgi:hypothetical protein
MSTNEVFDDVDVEEFYQPSEAELEHEDNERLEAKAVYLAQRDAARREEAAQYAVSFPESAYKGSLAKLARLLGEKSEVPFEFIYLAAITTFGLIASDKLRLTGDGLDTRSNLYTVLLGPTGCKKSTALDQATKFFSEMNYLTSHLKEQGGTALVYPIAGSGEGLIKLFQAGRKRVLLSVDELQSMLQKCRVDNSTLGPILASMFDGGLVGMATKDHQESLNNVHLGLQGAITTQSWYAIWTKGTERELGLLNRLFLVSGVPRPKVFMPGMVDAKKLAKIQIEIMAQITKVGPMQLGADGLKVFEQFYMQLDLTQEEATRLDTLAKKLALILAATSDKTEIDKEVATAAVEMCEYQLKVRKLLAPSRAQTMAAATENKIRKFLEGVFLKGKKEFVYESVIADKTCLKETVGMEVVNRGLKSLVESGEVLKEQTKQGKAKYRLNYD